MFSPIGVPVSQDGDLVLIGREPVLSGCNVARFDRHISPLGGDVFELFQQSLTKVTARFAIEN